MASRKLMIGLLLLFGFAPTISASTETLPVKVELPSECQMESFRSGGWVCDYTANNGRDRRFVLDFHAIELDAGGRESLSRMDAETLEMVMENEIKKIDERRGAAQPAGSYAKLRYEFLDRDSRPSGFVSCVVSQDEMTLDGSDTRNDRVSLHCWAAEPVHGLLYQMLFSMIEFNEPTQDTTTTLGEEFDGIVASVKRD